VAVFADRLVATLLGHGRHALSLLIETLARLLDRDRALPTREEELRYLRDLVAREEAIARLYSPLHGLAEAQPEDPLAASLAPWQDRKDIALLLHRPHPGDDAGREPQIGWAAAALARQGRLVLLLDGLNEVPSAQRRAKTDRIRAFRARLPEDTPFIVSCRRDDLEQQGAIRVREPGAHNVSLPSRCFPALSREGRGDLWRGTERLPLVKQRVFAQQSRTEGQRIEGVRCAHDRF
jgi:hypothetical protein